MTQARRTLAALVVLALGVVLATPATAGAQDGEERDDFVVLTGRAEVGEGETFGNVVVFDGDAVVDGTVEDSVVVFNGNTTVAGTVAENVVSFNGLVTIRSGAEVGGDLVSRQTPVVEDGATVRGETRANPGELFRRPLPFFGLIAAWLAVSVSVLVLGLLILWLAPRGADAVADVWRTATGPSVGWGLILLVGLPLLAIVLLITLVGIPFGVGLLLGLFLIYSVGYTLGALVVGGWFVKPPRSRMAAFLVGFAILRLLALIPFVAGLVGAAAAVIGLGALAVAVWRARRPTAVAAPA
jgi:hypothetical protein